MKICSVEAEFRADGRVQTDGETWWN